jgi:hypothetical protein
MWQLVHRCIYAAGVFFIATKAVDAAYKYQEQRNSPRKTR